jgi:hypothetical protein
MQQLGRGGQEPIAQAVPAQKPPTTSVILGEIQAKPGFALAWSPARRL